jgi:hypothetical protein
MIKNIFRLFLYFIAMLLSILDDVFAGMGNLFKNLFGNNHKKIKDLENKIDTMDEKFMNPKQIFDKYNNN